VDDEEVLAELGKQLLEMLGYVVSTTTSPLEAIQAVQDQPGKFDLIITDLTMPGMDGAKLGAKIRKLQPHLPIILMTGNSGLLKSDDLLDLGHHELLGKPCDAETLGKTVDRVLRATARSPLAA
jgi:CheY-like chemotaxis protein